MREGLQRILAPSPLLWNALSPLSGETERGTGRGWGGLRASPHPRMKARSRSSSTWRASRIKSAPTLNPSPKLRERLQRILAPLPSLWGRGRGMGAASHFRQPTRSARRDDDRAAGNLPTGREVRPRQGTFTQPHYNEAQLRQEFVNPLFPPSAGKSAIAGKFCTKPASAAAAAPSTPITASSPPAPAPFMSRPRNHR